MRSSTYNRRRTDTGHTPQRPSRLQVLRSILGLQPPSESLRQLSWWRRRNAAK